MPETFQELIDLFPSRSEFARRCGSDPDLGRVWHRRNAVPRRLMPRVIEVCRDAGIDLDEARFKALAARAGANKGVQ